MQRNQSDKLFDMCSKSEIEVLYLKQQINARSYNKSPHYANSEGFITLYHQLTIR